MERIHIRCYKAGFANNRIPVQSVFHPWLWFDLVREAVKFPVCQRQFPTRICGMIFE
jgi:hypothetical protein